MPRHSPFSAARDGVRLAIRLVPKAKADRIVGLIADAEGGVALKVSVRAPPADGKANAALLRFLSVALRLRRGDLTLVLGSTDRRKLVQIAGEPAQVTTLLDEGLRPWLKHG